VLGLGEQVSSTAPQVNVDWEESNTTDLTGDGGPNAVEVTATHDGGSTVDDENIEVISSGATTGTVSGGATEIDAGTLLGGVDGASPGDTIRVRWTSDDGGTSATLSEYTVQG
jgi:hypothetical protein